MADGAFEIGHLAEHSRKADWGPGKVVKVRTPYVWVFFRDAPGRVARQFPTSLLVRSSCQTDAVLENLPAFIEQDGVHELPRDRFTLREALAIFQENAPTGFAAGGPLKAQKDRDARRAAAESWALTLGGGRAEELLAQGAIAALTLRTLAVVTLGKTLSTGDAAALRLGLADEGSARHYFEALLGFLAGEPNETTFAAYVSAANSLAGTAAAGASWPMLTLLPFLAQPDRHLLLRPTVTCTAATRLGFDLHFSPTPNWTTYQALLRLGDTYRRALAEAGARDMADVHLFFSALVSRS